MYDIAIIGGGPAGMTAGIYAARAGLSAAVFEGNMTGGQAVNAHNIENYPGFASGVSGFELAYAMQSQAKRLGVTFINAKVDSAELNAPIKTFEAAGILHEAKTVVIATGATARTMDIDREDEFIGAGISYCATCDGGFFKGKTVAVIGGGDTAITDAQYLARLAEKVYIIHRRGEFRAAKYIIKAALENSNVEPLYNTIVAGIEGDSALKGLLIKDVNSGAVTRLAVSGAFVAIGNRPNTSIFTGQIETKDGYIVADNTQTSLPGVFVAGDVISCAYRQIVVACSSGAIAAMKAGEYISANGGI